MIFYVLLLIALVISTLWLTNFILLHVEKVTITWGSWGSYEINSTHLLILFLLAFVIFYLLIGLLKFLLKIKHNFHNYQQSRWVNKTREELTQGLMLFISGHWADSERVLLRNIMHAEMPLLNYLAAARAAHMQEHYDDRDHYLKIAAEQGGRARVAVAVSQAQMQFGSQQTEQARATLVHLLEFSPEHPYACQLLAKVYYRQEDWKHLFKLLPKLKQKHLLKDRQQKKFEVAALKGVFQLTALQKRSVALQALWEELPKKTKEKASTVSYYIDALLMANDTRLAEKILSESLNQQWDEGLIERFGKIEHRQLSASIQQAEHWLEQYDNSPELLFCLARLYRSNKNWDKSCSFYEAGLNMMPEAKIYLEFAQLLTELKEEECAILCYQKGLRYCLTQKGETLNLQRTNNS